MCGDEDAAVRIEAEREAAHLLQQTAQIEHELVLQLVPKAEDDDRDVVMEVRAGTGGQEAAMFAQELFDMYALFAGPPSCCCFPSS